MQKYSFLNDYSEGCHPDILKQLVKHNLTQQLGYGSDTISEQAKTLLRHKANAPDSMVHFVTGGTQANLICLAAMLQPFEAVIAVSTAHIVTNEAGAIEATGHKIIDCPSIDGKLTVADIDRALKKYARPPHTVRPKVVYITNATELGTVYSKDELTSISRFCREHGLYLFLDGARLGLALASADSELTLADIAHLTDVFWLGGTKMGALLGEAIVINTDEIQADFACHMKQRGALLAKGSILGMQFLTLLEDDLYLTMSHHANQMASKLSQGMVDAGFELFTKTQSNQVFAVIPHEVLERLQKQFIFHEWERRENHSLVRLVTSWATQEAQVDSLIHALNC